MIKKTVFTVDQKSLKRMVKERKSSSINVFHVVENLLEVKY